MLDEMLSTLLGVLMAVFAFISVPLYPIAQVAVVLLRRGVGMWLALLPIAPMVQTFMEYRHYAEQGSNLAPIMLIFASPFALCWVLLTGYFARPRDLSAIIDRWWPRRWD